ncbi:MAG: hypothetical protein U0441_07490 [Polyangiaceae bacterium]
MKRTVYLGIGDGGLWLSLIGEEIPKKATVLDAKQAKFWLKQAVPPMAHPTILHAISEIAEGVGYPFHGAMAFADLPWVMDALERALQEKRLVAYRAVSLEGGGKGPTPPTPPPPPPPPPPPTPVNPLIEPASLVVVVKKIAKNPATKADEAVTFPKRQPVKLATDAAFDGTATFTCDKADKVKFFSAATGGVEIKFDGTANVFKPGAPPAWAPGASISSGVTVYAEGAAPSAAMDDVTIKLELKGGSKPTGAPDTATITSVEVTLDLHKPRPSPGAAPPAFSKDDKVFVGRNLLVQNTTKSFERAELVIQKVKPEKFTGTLVLKPKTGAVDAFADEDPKKAGQASLLPFEIAANKIPAGGHKLFAEGKSASGAMRDTGFVLGVKGVDDEGDKVTITSVEIKLDLCKSRTVAQATASPIQDPTPLSDEDKVKVGRFVHQQDAGTHHGRALLVVRKVKPEKFDGVLVLEGVTPKTELFQQEFAVIAGPKTTVPHDFDYKTEKNEDKRLWVEGKTVSGALRDGGYRLHLKGDPATNSDNVKLTVVKFENLKIEIPSTPPVHTRANNAPPAFHTKTISGAQQDQFEFDDVLNKSLVLIEDSVVAAKPIKLSVKVTPADAPISWDAPRDVRPGTDGDHATIRALSGKPTVTPDAKDKHKATMITNGVGTFHVAAFVDSNGSGTFDPTADVEPYLHANLVLVRVEGIRNDSVAQPANAAATNMATGIAARQAGTTVPAGSPAPSAAGGAIVISGMWAAATAAAYSKATVKVTGGGDDGQRGLDRVFSGWCQHIDVSPTSASNPQGLDIFARYQHQPPTPPAQPGKPPPAPPAPVFHRQFFIFTQQNPAGGAFGPGTNPTVESCPAIDVTPTGVDAAGGDSCTGQWGGHGSFTQPIAKVNKPIGQEWTVDTLDSPSVGHPAAHPFFPGSMIEFRFNINFRVDLLFWTNFALSATPTGDVADNLYASVQTNNWTVGYAVNFDPTTGLVVGANPAVSVVMNKDPSPTRKAITVEGTGLETRFPIALRLFKRDARA